MMLSPKPAPNAAPNHAGFDRLIEDVARQHNVLKHTPDYAIESGVNVYALVRYAAAMCDESEKRAVESDLCRLPWCTEVVVALVKATRTTPHPLLDLAYSGALEDAVEHDDLADMLEALRAG